MKKYNPIQKQFEEYTVPDDWNVQIIPENLSDSCNCAECGKLIDSWSNSIMSHLIQPDDASAPRQEPSYAICRDCMNKELELELQYL